MGISSVWIDILEVSSCDSPRGGGCGERPRIEGGSDLIAWSSAAGGRTPFLEGREWVGSLAFRAPNCGPVSPTGIFEVDVLDFFDVGRGKPPSSSSSSLGISRLMGPLDSLSLEALTPAWSLMRARVELM